MPLQEVQYSNHEYTTLLLLVHTRCPLQKIGPETTCFQDANFETVIRISDPILWKPCPLLVLKMDN